MLNNRWIKLLAAIVTVLGLFVGARHVPQWKTDPPTLRLPANIAARTGRLVVITPETAATQVRWHTCSGSEKPDVWHTPDGKTLVFCAAAPGRYELWAWTASPGEASDAVNCIVTVESPEPPPAPDAFQSAINGAWLGESGPDRFRQRDLLASLYRIASADTVHRQSMTTVGELFTAMQQASKSLLPTDALPTIRSVIAAELRLKLPTEPGTPLDAATRDRFREQFARVAKVLSELR